MKIVKTIEPNTNFGESITFTGGSHDGETFRHVYGLLENGEIIKGIWISDKSSKCYKRVFVPWDYEGDKMILV